MASGDSFVLTTNSLQFREVRQEVNLMRASFTGMAQEAKQFQQLFGQSGSGLMSSSGRFQQEAKQMQYEFMQVRTEAKQLQGMKAEVNITAADKATPTLKQLGQQIGQLVSKGANLALSVGAGTSLDKLNTEIMQLQQEEWRYRAKGATPDEVQEVERQAKELTFIQPGKTQAEMYSLLMKSRDYHGTSGDTYAEVAAKLELTTGVDADQWLKAMTAMKQSYGIDDPVRLGNTLQYMANNVKDVNGELVESLIKYSDITHKFLDTPEKLAMLVEDMGNVNVMSLDQNFQALKEAALLLSNQGEVENLLLAGYQAKHEDPSQAEKMAKEEAQAISQLLQSSQTGDQQEAMSRLMLAFASLENVPARQAMLSRMGGNIGKENVERFEQLLQVAGATGTSERKPALDNQLEKSYQSVVQDNPFLEYQRAQAEARASLVELGTKVYQDVLPALTVFAGFVRDVADMFSQMSDVARLGAELLVGGMLLWKTVGPVVKTVRGMTSKGKKTSPVGGSLGSLMCCCGGAMGSIGGKGGGKRGRGKRGVATAGAPGRKGARGSAGNRGSQGGRAGQTGAGNQGKRRKKGVKAPASSAIAQQQLLPTGGGNSIKPERPVSAASKLLKPLQAGKQLLRRIPGIGHLLGAAEVATSDNKGKAMGRFAAESGGALIGAAIGSVVPVVGTAVGGLIGGAIGSFGGSYLFDKVSDWFGGSDKKTESPAQTASTSQTGQSPTQLAAQSSTQFLTQVSTQPPMRSGAMPHSRPISPVTSVNMGAGYQPISPVSVGPVNREQRQLPSITVQAMPITLNAEGILQDVSGLLRLLRDPAVGNEVKRMIERAFIDALETRGGVGRVGGVVV